MKRNVDYNSHHVLFSRKTWESTPNTYALRQERGLIVPMELAAHAALHREVTVVPVPDHYTAMFAVRALQHQANPMRQIDRFMQVIEQAGQNKNARPLDRQLGQLVIASIEAQLPFIREGFVDLRKN